ncbi:uncharacterized protein T551_03358 [Pneumocystis jirovecii RU7]|uniref:Transcription initiation factor TFIID subunit 2 n=1 Tax=Pneumocystis jirovecii (strain RU7) TaxID=1408657 RepID=A0A0W4ZET4_PNEJ7|nr:uncharacterized protein T551_03358 [Pneumocystis jirovecii RU7]KTW26896.1 hypothetical protein T551_03358 [Pneumocystis jirovecii RU7]
MSETDTHETWVGRGFNIAHQKVVIDINFMNYELRGYTEITILPTDPLLRKIRINAFDCDIESVFVNEVTATFEYILSKNELKLYKRSNVHHHHLLKKKFEAFQKALEHGNLTINIPKSEPKKANENTIQTEIKDIDDSNTPTTQKDAFFSLFSPIIIKINYSVKNPSAGLNFVGCEINDDKYPHVYTTHVPISGATSNWLPCIEGIWDRCTWDFEITVPKTLRDMWILSDSSNLSNGNNLCSNNSNTDKDDILSQPYNQLEFKVICSGDQLDEFTTPENIHKKTVCFSLGSLVSSQYIAFVVGPFEEINLTNFRDTDKDDTMGSSAVEVLGYCLPGRVTELKNSCMFIYKAIDFFVQEYGSYPYNIFKLCFVDDHPTSAVSCASMVIANNNLLFPPDIVDPIYSTTRTLTFTLASQWIGVNIVPKHWNDIWLTIGLAYYITDLFLCKLMGNNDYRFRLKKAVEKVCEEDIGRPALSDPQLTLPIDPFSIEFISLKAPVVLYILEKRLTKSGASWGLSRIIPKLFLQAMGGTLANNALSTSHFLKISEKVSRVSLDVFAQQWIHGRGYPRLRVIQRFNRKKMLIEIGIRQVQDIETPPKSLTVTDFFNDAKFHANNISNSTFPIFTGTMTIRIHEADGTPYDHVVELKEAFTKLDIQYNIKNKRFRRNQSKKQKKDMMDIDGVGDIDNDNDFSVQCFGDILQSEQEIKNWKLEDWLKEDEEMMSEEAFEWIRLDADFEWICIIWVNQPDYMYFSQLRQDRDVIAQYEAIQYFSNSKGNCIYSSILLRTLMDSRYYYGIRCEAALALVKCATEDLDWIGWYHLFKAFQTNYCFPNSSISKSNNFSNLSEYYVQCIIPIAMSKIRDKKGNSLIQIKKFLIDLLRYNDNSSNEYSDCYYICTLLNSLASTLITENKESFEFNFAMNDPENKNIIDTALSEIERFQRIDQLLPSFQNIISITSLKIKYLLSKAGIIPLNFQEILPYTHSANYDLVRLTAFDVLLKLGGLRQSPFTYYVFSTISSDRSPAIRRYLSFSISEALALMALNDQQSQIPIITAEQMIIEDDVDKAIEEKKRVLVRANISGAITALKQEIMEEETLKEQLWASLNSEKLEYIIRLNFLNIVSLLFDPKESRLITLKIPNTKPKLTAQIIGEGKLIIRKETLTNKKLPEGKRLPKIKIKIGNTKQSLE